MLHCTHTKRATAVWQTPLSGSVSLQSPYNHGQPTEQRVPHSGDRSTNSFLIPCRYSCKSACADCLRGVLWSMSSDNGRTHNLPISKEQGYSQYFISLAFVYYTLVSPTVFDHNADKKDSTLIIATHAPPLTQTRDMDTSPLLMYLPSLHHGHRASNPTCLEVHPQIYG
jgi:hypothetical protein